MGVCPDDYTLFKIADYCHCKPWELLEVSKWWQIKAMQYMEAENSARKTLEARNK